MAVFSDLCVSWSEENNKVEEKVKQLIRLGYKLFAVNNVFTHPAKPKGKKEKSQQKPLTPPLKILLPEEKLKIHYYGTITNTGEKLKQLSRLTMIFSEADQIHTLQSADVQAYDLLAVQPTTEKLFHMACGTLDIDIISVNMMEQMPFRYKRPSLNMAVERGVFFEIQYGPMIRDREACKNIIANVQMLLEVGKGKNLILSSGCENPLDIRGPYDVTALGLMLGLSEAKAKQALSTNCNSVLLHAAARKAGRSVVSITRLDRLPNKDKWVTNATDPSTLEVEDEESAPENSEEDEEVSGSEDESDHEPPTKKKKKT